MLPCVSWWCTILSSGVRLLSRFVRRSDSLLLSAAVSPLASAAQRHSLGHSDIHHLSTLGFGLEDAHTIALGTFANLCSMKPSEIFTRTPHGLYRCRNTFLQHLRSSQISSIAGQCCGICRRRAVKEVADHIPRALVRNTASDALGRFTNSIYVQTDCNIEEEGRGEKDKQPRMCESSGKRSFRAPPEFALTTLRVGIVWAAHTHIHNTKVLKSSWTFGGERDWIGA